MARNDGWVPQQHGAWAMIAVPALVGLVRAGRDAAATAATTHVPRAAVGEVLTRVVLVVAFLLGYFCFNAMTLWVKAKPSRGAAFVQPAGIYGLGAALALMVVLVRVGPGLLWWALPFAPLTGGALALTAAKRERSLLSGGLTIAASSLFGATVLQPDLPVLLRGAWPGAATLVALCFLSFFGTVFVVKTMIRERGSRGWYAASIGWHVAATLACLAATFAIGLSPAFVVFFAVATVRAALLPRLGPLHEPPRRIRPMQLGLVEMVFSLALLLLLL